MPRKSVIILSIIYLAINAVVFWMEFNNHLSNYVSINTLLALLFSGIFGIKNYLLASLFYLPINAVIFCGAANSTIKKYQMIIVLIVGIGISIPILNANGL
ncbi:hypothetical protein [Cellulophaga sp. 3_MG-2023]|uniref:hypothetical protein n=1 Tax=Cellulophaga sp. 3_MG-2023 TaxID=3062675 RepID=UPI0026E3273C|nr:hypothetical protein [Cellulophaga sp. 3_MG-2023]MDO6493081.1 hypothetical protein [Cellulophaga sp. 2_MG-2023]